MTTGCRAALAALAFAVLSAGLAPRPALAGQAPAGELAAQAVKASGFEQGLCLPSGSSLTEEDQLRVINTVRSISGRMTGSDSASFSGTTGMPSIAIPSADSV